jgi:hypothetical protein
MNWASNFILIVFSTATVGTLSFILSKAPSLFTTIDIALIVTVLAVPLLCLASFRLDKSTRQLLALCLISAALAAVTAEFVIASGTSTRNYDNTVGGKSGRQALLELRKGGQPAYASLLHADITASDANGKLQPVLKVNGEALLPLSGVARATTLLCNETGTWTSYFSDQFGFRNPEPIWQETPDLAMVGDSFTQGNCVVDGDSFVDRLRNVYPKTLNLGQRGNGPFAILASIREYLSARHPKTTIWFHFEGNDFPGDFVREKRTPLLVRYLEPEFSQNLIEREAEISSVFARYIDQRLLSGPKRAGRVAANSNNLAQRILASFSLYQIRTRLGFSDFPDHGSSETFRNVLKTAKNDIANWRGNLVLVYLPAPRRFASASARRMLDRYRKVVIEATASLQIPMLDLSVPFHRLPEPAKLYRGHFTEEGHALVARQVQRFLERQTQ